jgi:hypothetical protein
MRDVGDGSKRFGALPIGIVPARGPIMEIDEKQIDERYFAGTRDNPRNRTSTTEAQRRLAGLHGKSRSPAG